MRALGTVFTFWAFVAVASFIALFYHFHRHGMIGQIFEDPKVINWWMLYLPVSAAVGVSVWNRRRIPNERKLAWRKYESLSTTGVVLATWTAAIIVTSVFGADAPGFLSFEVDAGAQSLADVIAPIITASASAMFFYKKAQRKVGDE